MWRVLYRGDDFGHIAAHDEREALDIARDAMPPRWDRSALTVSAA